MSEIFKPITILKTIGEVQPIDEDFLSAQVKTLKEHLNQSEIKVINQQFEIDRLDARVNILNIVVSEYKELLDNYKKRLNIND